VKIFGPLYFYLYLYLDLDITVAALTGLSSPGGRRPAVAGHQPQPGGLEHVRLVRHAADDGDPARSARVHLVVQRAGPGDVRRGALVHRVFGLGLVYFYSHYFFASSNAHVTAMFGPFLAVALALDTPPFLAALVLGFYTSLFAVLTHYGGAAAPILFGSGYVALGAW
jgi:hypothetical protein